MSEPIVRWVTEWWLIGILNPGDPDEKPLDPGPVDPSPPPGAKIDYAYTDVHGVRPDGYMLDPRFAAIGRGLASRNDPWAYDDDECPNPTEVLVGVRVRRQDNAVIGPWKKHGVRRVVEYEDRPL